MVFLELLAVLEPLQGRRRVPAGLTSELDRLTGGDGVELLLHFLRVSPLGGHGCGTRTDRQRQRDKKLTVSTVTFLRMEPKL